jgi:hypothetical protein
MLGPKRCAAAFPRSGSLLVDASITPHQTNVDRPPVTYLNALRLGSMGRPEPTPHKLGFVMIPAALQATFGSTRFPDRRPRLPTREREATTDRRFIFTQTPRNFPKGRVLLFRPGMNRSLGTLFACTVE